VGSGIASGDSSFYQYNRLGTTIALTNAAESVTDTYRHDAWGVQLSSTGSTVNPHTYVGQQRYYRMPDASLYHLGFRDYAQRAGRFTTRDPLHLMLAVSGQGGVLLRPGGPSSGELRPTGGVADRATAQRHRSEAVFSSYQTYDYALNRPSVLSDPGGTSPVLGIIGICIVIVVGSTLISGCPRQPDTPTPSPPRPAPPQNPCPGDPIWPCIEMSEAGNTKGKKVLDIDIELCCHHLVGGGALPDGLLELPGGVGGSWAVCVAALRERYKGHIDYGGV